MYIDIEVGDKVTHKSIEEPDEEAREYVIKDEHQLADIISYVIKNEIEILKIERPKYEVVENKELLTDEEKQFLKDMCKYHNITSIEFDGDTVNFYDSFTIVNCPDYPENMKFENVKKYKNYTLKELGLEE